MAMNSIDLVLRPYRGPQDHPAMNRVANAVRAANGDPNLGSVADMDRYYGRFDQVELPRDCAVVEVDGMVVAYGRASWDELSNGDGQISCALNVDPALAGRGIVERLIDHAIRRAATLIETRGRERTTHFWIFATDRDVDQIKALEAAGFRRIRSAAQLIRPTLDDIPDVPMPPGFQIRPTEATDVAMQRRVYDADARAFADSWGHEAPSDAEFERWLTGPTFDPPLWRVAFHDDEIAGQILNYMGEPEPDGRRIGWTEAISVQPEFRRRGLARALLAASLVAVRDAGATQAGLGVDMQNPNEAQALYESMGYRVVSLVYGYELGPYPPGSVGPKPAGEVVA